MTKNQLLEKLQQQISQLFTSDNRSKVKLVLANFNPAVFSENFQSFHFYENEMQKTLQQIAAVNEQDEILLNALTEKLLSQYECLSEHLNPQKITHLKAKPDKNAIHSLPPRERLGKYYEALRILNEKIIELEDANRLNPSSLLTQQIMYQQERCSRCELAIENLEEYLLFKEEQEKLL